MVNEHITATECNATLLATILGVHNPLDYQDEYHLSDALYVAIEHLGFGTDERKADLYAQLAETLKVGMGFYEASLHIQKAMTTTNKRFPHA